MKNRSRTAWLAFAFLFAFLTAAVPAAAADRALPAQQFVRVLIGFREMPGSAQEAVVRAFGGAVRHIFHLIPSISAEIPESAVEALKKNPLVALVEPDVTFYAMGSYEEELAETWGLTRIGEAAAHAQGSYGTGIKVAVIDSGVDYTHPELAAVYKGGWDFVNGDADPMDTDGHGTHVAGTIAAARDGQGVAGAAPQIELYALKVMQGGTGDFSDIIEALEWCVDHGIQVTNNSYGSSADPGTQVKNAFDNAYASGILHIAAAGNIVSPNIFPFSSYPAWYSSVVAVAASDSSDQKASFSNYGSKIELIAPGDTILSAYPLSKTEYGGYCYMSGTSMASPHVAGAAAQVWAIDRTLTNVQVRAILCDTAEDLGLSAERQGNGLVRADLAAAAARSARAQAEYMVSAAGTYDIGGFGGGSVIRIGAGLAVTLTNGSGTTFANMSILCAPGVTLTLNGVKIDNSPYSGVCALSFEDGGNRLLLSGESALRGGACAPGVRVEGSTDLSVSGSGAVTVLGGAFAAGIGGEYGADGGSIAIEGGTVRAQGGTGAAGIGNGCAEQLGAPMDVSVTISGGIVEAAGTAGIGGGPGSGNVTIGITGGTVRANGSEGVCIGAADGVCADIAVSGGTVQILDGDVTPSGAGSFRLSGEGIILSNGTVTAPVSGTHDLFSSAVAEHRIFGLAVPDDWTGTAYAYLNRDRVFTLVFDANGGTGDPDGLPGPLTQYAGTSAVLPGCGLIGGEDGFPFERWNTEPDDTGITYRPNGEYVFSGNGTLYAVYGARIPVTDVSLDRHEAVILVSETVQLAAAVSPSGASDPRIVWSSGSESVAGVSGAGLVTGKSPGTAVITATSADGGFTDSCAVTVKAGRIVSSVYAIDQAVIKGVSIHTSAAQLIADLGNDPADLLVLDRNGAAYSGSQVRTGMRVRLTISGRTVDEAAISVPGDISGDGIIDVTDILYIRAHILKTYPLAGAEFQAADIDRSSATDITDILYIRADILGTYHIHSEATK